MEKGKHYPVLLQEVMEYLSPQEKDIVVDGTGGAGGHSLALCNSIGKAGILVVFDKDETALNCVRETLKDSSCEKIYIHAGFETMRNALSQNQISGVDKILLDLGLSSMQLADEDRGFSLKTNAQLDMRYSKTQKITAEDIVNNWSEETLADIIYGFADERFARRIAKGIVEERKKEPISSTGRLVEIIESSVPAWYKKRKIHCATKTFQAMRIAVNEELDALERVLPDAFRALTQGGRLAVISYHSLEDRIVKRFMKNLKQENAAEIKTKKPIVAGKQELLNNPRSRSAKLRVLEKI